MNNEETCDYGKIETSLTKFSSSVLATTTVNRNQLWCITAIFDFQP